MWNKIFRYENGCLIWINPKRKPFLIGKSAGTRRSDGYHVIRINGRLEYRHRIIWEMHNVRIPEGFEIDHINHVPGDDMIENLRLVSKTGNMKNTSIHSNNTSGFNGVSFDGRRGKWIACIGVNGKCVKLGRFKSIVDAVEARIISEVKLNYHKNHGGK